MFFTKYNYVVLNKVSLKKMEITGFCALLRLELSRRDTQ